MSETQQKGGPQGLGDLIERLLALAETLPPYGAETASWAAEALSFLSDPVAVHHNMLRGNIAKPSVSNIVHLYGGAIKDATP